MKKKRSYKISVNGEELVASDGWFVVGVNQASDSEMEYRTAIFGEFDENDLYQLAMITMKHLLPIIIGRSIQNDVRAKEVTDEDNIVKVVNDYLKYCLGGISNEAILATYKLLSEINDKIKWRELSKDEYSTLLRTFGIYLDKEITKIDLKEFFKQLDNEVDE